jgi:lysophospholipase L1-like esterase
MKNILCYGDSNTWGYIPGTGERFAAEQRWPGILQQSLGKSFHIIEAGLNGRTTIFDDPTKAGCNGLSGLAAVLDAHAALDAVILMLGTNDLKHHLNVSAVETARGIECLVDKIRSHAEDTAQNRPHILIVSPPRICTTTSASASLFQGAGEKSHDLPRLFAEVANNRRCHFLDAARLVNPSAVDGVHLDLQGHARLGQTIGRMLAATSV